MSLAYKQQQQQQQQQQVKKEIKHKPEQSEKILLQEISELKQKCLFLNKTEIFITEIYKAETKKTILLSQIVSPVTGDDSMYNVLGFNTRVTRMFYNEIDGWQHEVLYHVGSKEDVLHICSQDRDYFTNSLNALENNQQLHVAKYLLDSRVHGTRLLDLKKG